MGKNGLGLRRSGGNKNMTPRAQGLAAGKGGRGLHPVVAERPWMPDTPQDHSRDAERSAPGHMLYSSADD